MTMCRKKFAPFASGDHAAYSETNPTGYVGEPAARCLAAKLVQVDLSRAGCGTRFVLGQLCSRRCRFIASRRYRAYRSPYIRIDLSSESQAGQRQRRSASSGRHRPSSRWNRPRCSKTFRTLPPGLRTCQFAKRRMHMPSLLSAEPITEEQIKEIGRKWRQQQAQQNPVMRYFVRRPPLWRRLFNRLCYKK